MLLERAQHLLTDVQSPILFRRVCDRLEELCVDQELPGVEHLPPVGVAPAFVDAAVGAHHVGIPALLARPEVFEISLAALGPFTLGPFETFQVVLVQGLEVAPAVVVSLRLTLRTMALEGVGRYWGGMPCSLHGFQHVLLPAARRTGEVRLPRHGSLSGRNDGAVL